MAIGLNVVSAPVGCLGGTAIRIPEGVDATAETFGSLREVRDHFDNFAEHYRLYANESETAHPAYAPLFWGQPRFERALQPLRSVLEPWIDMRGIILALAVLLGVCTGAAAQQQQTDNYPLQPGDSIQVSVWQDPRLNRTVVVGPDGMVSFPLAGHIRAAGMTTQALESLLSEQLRPNYKTDPEVTVTLSGANAVITGSQVFVTGEVQKPGPVFIKTGTSVVQVIALSGGLSKFAAKSRIQVHRRVAGTERVFVFNYSDFESGTNLQGNIALRPGDVILVPERGLFY
jgi:polysaccharide biosynthesis/export protein